jgi:dihydroorotase-like cyclic amidohydrolase
MSFRDLRSLSKNKSKTKLKLHLFATKHQHNEEQLNQTNQLEGIKSYSSYSTLPNLMQKSKTTVSEYIQERDDRGSRAKDYYKMDRREEPRK